MKQLKAGINTGLIIQKPTATDKVFGSSNEIGFVDILSTGDWRPYLPDNEVQFSAQDMMACVSFSALNSLETQLNFQLVNNFLSSRARAFLTDNGYIAPSGKVNFSDRFLAKMSGTTVAGNSFLNVWDSLRNDGLLPDKDWAMPASADWATYYQGVSQELKDKAKRFLDYFEIKYEWVRYDLTVSWETVEQNLKQAPLQIASAVCAGWNSGEVISTCSKVTSHATLLTAPSNSLFIPIYDSYDPFNKKLALDYTIPFVMKGVITERPGAIANPGLLARLEGKYIQRVEAHGEIYKVLNGQLNFLDPNKQADGHTPLFDSWSKELQAQGKLVGLSNTDYDSITKV